MATIRKRGRTWQVQVRRSGKQPTSASFPSKAKAMLWAAEMESHAGLGMLRPAKEFVSGITSLGVLLERYEHQFTALKKGAEKERFVIRLLQRDGISTLDPWQLTSADVAAYRDRRLAVVQSGTARRELAVLRHCLNVARREWGLPSLPDPFSSLRLPRHGKARVRRLSCDEQDRLDFALYQSRAKDLRALVRLAIQTAMRRGELLSLRWSQIDLNASVAVLPDTKNGQARRVPLTPNAIAELTRLPRTGDMVFSARAGSLSSAWMQVVKVAQINDLRFHDLRHESISRFFEMGLSVAEVALISGHKDVRMLFRYTHLRAEDVAKKLSQV